MSCEPQLCIGLSLAPTWLSGEGWRAPDSGIEGLYSSDFALEVARRAEAAHLDFVFRPDAHFLPVPALEQSFGFSSLDPTLLMAAIARETSRIGLLTTVSTTFAHPYIAARQLMSLHWLSRGRAGWNVVTALAGHENFGLAEMPPSEIRYARAREFVEVVQALWQSFPDEALLIDRAAGRYADTGQIRPVAHRGAHFAVQGPMNLPRFPGPRLPMMQAGASANGIELAAGLADMVFAQTATIEAARAMRRALSDRAEAQGRAPRDVRLLPGLSLYLGETRAEAQELFLATHRRMTRAQRVARLREATGLDVEGWADDARILPAHLPPAPPLPQQRAAFDRVAAALAGGVCTVAGVLSGPEILGSVHWQIIGTVEDAAAEIGDWFRAGAVDGFVAVPGGSARSLELMLGSLIPRLAQEGLFRRGYRGATFWEHLQPA